MIEILLALSVASCDTTREMRAVDTVPAAVCVIEGTASEVYRGFVFPLSGVEIWVDKVGLDGVVVETDQHGRYQIWDESCAGGPYELTAKDVRARTLNSREHMAKWSERLDGRSPRYRPHFIPPFNFRISAATALEWDVRLTLDLQPASPSDAEEVVATAGDEIAIYVFYEFMPTGGRLTVNGESLLANLVPAMDPSSLQDREHVYRFKPTAPGHYDVVLHSFFDDVFVTREAAFTVR